MNDCIFCKIINGDIPAKTIYEDELVKIFLDVNPISNGHMLIVPKKHRTDLFELTNEEIIHIYEIGKKMVKLTMDKLNDDGVKLLANYGSYQEVKHFHLHIIPGKNNQNEELKNVDEIYQKLTK